AQLRLNLLHCSNYANLLLLRSSTTAAPACSGLTLRLHLLLLARLRLHLLLRLNYVLQTCCLLALNYAECNGRNNYHGGIIYQKTRRRRDLADEIEEPFDDDELDEQLLERQRRAATESNPMAVTLSTNDIQTKLPLAINITGHRDGKRFHQCDHAESRAPLPSQSANGSARSAGQPPSLRLQLCWLC
uniref:Protein TSSC4 n=1 Tax=Macrostomum lignano TaxID=282301 RepID=A0A1I8FF33_9PLAT